jgi:hypothetical protein
MLRWVPGALAALVLAACGGGGGGDNPPLAPANNPAPTLTSLVTTSAAAGSAAFNLSVTGSNFVNGSVVRWNGADRTTTFTSATQLSAAITAADIATAGTATVTVFNPAPGGGTSGGLTFTITAAGAPVVISGRVTYDKVPHIDVPPAGTRLNYAGIVQSPARGVTVEAVAAVGSAILATTATDANGNYSLPGVPANTQVLIRVKAEILRAGAPSWTFRVRDNTSAQGAPPASAPIWALDGAASSSGASNSTRNLNAPSGWDGTAYSGTRAAAPFSILDAVYDAYNLVLGAAPATAFPALNLFWSPNNGTVSPDETSPAAFAGSLARGDIGTTFFLPGAPASVYVLGQANVDTDEYDQHVIAHEWGHYYQDAFSRDESIGGPHGSGDRLDARVAFSEGFGNAFAGMAKQDPMYRDSLGPAQGQGFGFSVENNGSAASNPGWFSETSVQSLLWDFFDAANDGGSDTVALTFGPLHTVLTSEIRTTRALTTIYPFLNGLSTRNPAQAAAITTLVRNQDIGANLNDDFGAGETNGSTDPANNLPVYRTASAGQMIQVCSTTSGGGTYNRLGNRRFIRIDWSAAARLTASATRLPDAIASPSDPDLVLFRDGQELARAEGTVPDTETLASSGALAIGTYILEVYEFNNLAGSGRGTTCFNVQITAG